MEVGSKAENVGSCYEPPVLTRRPLPPVLPLSCAKPLFHNIPVLTSGGDYEIWKLRLQTILEGVSPAECFSQMMMALGDDMVRRATVAGFCKSNSILDNWAILDECFGGCQDASRHLRQFMDRQQRQDEPATDYLHELRYLASRALPSLSVAIREEMICARFSQGLQDRDLQLQLLRFPVQRVSEAPTVAQRFEDAAKSTTNPILFTIHDRQRPVSRGRSDSFHAAEPKKQNCYYCKRFGRFAVWT
ncbi:hypothetical protein EWB00_005912 [Schistosoma japonicum]|uniref:Uncharacterized protein n=1 Tax=Schistosoma japonicum TaxID=6182 RepID=A0A4Z2D014_SCHJA|nr:hypothetical protein EWB00_005912 [Schistosoma japonicum]TNN09862.1 hypothetical protein EWB00_005912 [Schistosoma japonicum]